MLDLKPYRALLSLNELPITLTESEIVALFAEIEELREVLAICLPLARDVVDVAITQFGGRENGMSQLDTLIRYIQRGNRLVQDGKPPLRLTSGKVKVDYGRGNAG